VRVIFIIDTCVYFWLLAMKVGGSGRNRSTYPVTSYEGQVLRITQVTKRHMGIYFCIASNGVPPSVSKRIAVTVLCKSYLQQCTMSISGDERWRGRARERERHRRRGHRLYRFDVITFLLLLLLLISFYFFLFDADNDDDDDDKKSHHRLAWTIKLWAFLSGAT
jgi:hypothetical protein